MKKNKGITLIALIITIIILLILVGVSLNLLIKGDLFGSAEKAVEGTNAKVNEQQTRVDELMGELDRINEKQAEHNWERTGDNLTCSHCNRTVTIGQELDYKDNGNGTSSISAEKAGGSSEIVESMLDKGIKIASLNPKENFKIVLAEIHSPTTTQTINKDSNTRWVVLGAEDSDKNGTNETLLITTKQPTTEKIKLYGAGGYNNAIEEINRMCKEIYGEDARGMTIEDVNNCLQYTPAGGMYYDSDTSSYKQTNNLTTKLSDLPTWNAIKDNHKTPDGKDTEENFGKVLLNGYYYYVSNDGTYLVNDANTSDTSNTITTATRNVIFGTSKDNRYWLASRGVYADSDFAGFGPGAVFGGDAYSCFGLFGSDGCGRVFGFSLRAVVSLRSDIPSVIE